MLYKAIASCHSSTFSSLFEFETTVLDEIGDILSLFLAMLCLIDAFHDFSLTLAKLSGFPSYADPSVQREYVRRCEHTKQDGHN